MSEEDGEGGGVRREKKEKTIAVFLINEKERAPDAPSEASILHKHNTHACAMAWRGGNRWGSHQKRKGGMGLTTTGEKKNE
jgi:hypothetical protein